MPQLLVLHTTRPPYPFSPTFNQHSAAIMATSPTATTSRAMTSSSLTTSSILASPTCDKESMPDLEWIIPAGYLQEGAVCAFPLVVPLNFTSCCAINQQPQNNGCYQFCVVNQTESSENGMDYFSECVQSIAETQNQTLGISGCKQKSSGMMQASRWRGSMLLVVTVMFSFVI